MARKVVYNNGYFEVSDEANIIHIKDLKGGVIIVPTTPSGDFILELIWRENINKYAYEFPRGFMESNEGSLDSAKRELKEELNIESDNLTYLGVVNTDSGIMDNSPHIFLAENLDCDIKPQDKEGIKRAIIVSKDKIESMINEGSITDSFTIVGYVKWLLHKKMKGEK